LLKKQIISKVSFTSAYNTSETYNLGLFLSESECNTFSPFVDTVILDRVLIHPFCGDETWNFWRKLISRNNIDAILINYTKHYDVVLGGGIVCEENFGRKPSRILSIFSWTIRQYRRIKQRKKKIDFSVQPNFDKIDFPFHYNLKRISRVDANRLNKFILEIEGSDYLKKFEAFSRNGHYHLHKEVEESFETSFYPDINRSLRKTLPKINIYNIKGKYGR